MSSRHILVPLDGSDLSAGALAIARMLAAGNCTQMHLLAVASRGEPAWTRELYAYLNEIASTERKEGMSVRTSVRTGKPADAILMLAHHIHADLIVMATHGRSGLGRVLLGSVADQVLRASAIPVVLLRPGARPVEDLQTMLVPIDGTVDGAVALSAAAPLAHASNAQMLIVHAVDISDGATAYVQTIAARLRELGMAAEGRAVAGRPADVISSLANEADVDLIVMSTHARSGPVRTVLGSVADEVVRRGQRPVLLVRRTSAITGRFDPAAVRTPPARSSVLPAAAL